MLLIRTLLFVACSCAIISPAWAEPDFFGVKMKGEDFAKNIIVLENNKVPDFSNNRPGTDKRIYAYAFTSTIVGGGKGVGVQVYNHSDHPFRTDRLYRELTLITRDGKRYDRSETEMMWSKDILMPGEEALFNFKFPGIRVDKEEIRLIICSFDMGETMIFLFPLRPYESHESGGLGSMEEEIKPKKKSLSEWLGFKGVGNEKEKDVKTAVPPQPSVGQPQALASPASGASSQTGNREEGKHCITPLKVVQAFFRDLTGNKGGADAPVNAQEQPLKNTPPLMAASPRNLLPSEPYQEFVIPGTQETLKVPLRGDGAGQVGASSEAAHLAANGQGAGAYPLVTAEQVMGDVKYNFRPNYREEVKQAQKVTDEKIYQDRPWSIQNPDQYMPYSKMMEFPKGGIPRRQAQVLMVNPDYGFVVVNAGYEEGFEKNLILDVLRNGRKIGKVMVTKPRDKIAGAIVLTEWRTATDIRVGDLVGVSG